MSRVVFGLEFQTSPPDDPTGFTPKHGWRWFLERDEDRLSEGSWGTRRQALIDGQHAAVGKSRELEEPWIRGVDRHYVPGRQG